MIDRTAIIEAAIAFHQHGACVIPVRADGSKAPAVNWRDYQARRPDLAQVIDWLASDQYDGFGLVTGAVSENLEMAEVEGRAVAAGALERLDAWADDNGMSELVQQLLAGYVERTPSGGIHFLYRLSDDVAQRNTKLAKGTDRQVLAETRGEGGFVVVAPSGGRTHPTGQAWTLEGGDPSTIPAITGEQRDMLWALLRMLDEEPARDAQPSMPSLPGGADAGTRPGDEFNEKASWDDILTPHGWTKAWKMGRGYAWRRPGKDTPGISATTGQAADGVDRLYVFTTSTEFESETPYSKFAAHAILEHGGDYAAAAKALGARGYGEPSRQPIGTSVHPFGDIVQLDDMPDIDNVLPDYESFADPDDDLADTPAEPMLSTPVRTLTATEMPASTLAQSEDGHSQAIIAEYGVEVRYCHELGRWLHWTGTRWERQSAGGGIVREFAKAIARDYPDDPAWRVHKKRSLTTQGINGALSLSTTDFRVHVGVDELDARPWEINTPGGIINLRTGAIEPCEPRRLHTRSTMVAPDFAADRSAWLRFLDTTFSGDADLIGFVQRLMGYACVGIVRESILPVFHGQGANGKTVLLETIQELLGDYATTLPPRFLVQGGQGVTDATVLLGARLAIAAETNEGERFDEAIVKRLTGGDTIRARYMRQDWFSFTPSHLLVLMTNHLPEVGSGGTSFWRRVRAIPFNNVLPPEQWDTELRARLVAEHGPAILAWVVEGAAEYVRAGLREPEGVRVATRQYEASTDTVGRFVADALIVGGGEHVKVNSAKVRAAYEAWCRSEGEVPINAKALTTQLVARYGVLKVKGSRGTRLLSNLALVESATHDDDAPHQDDAFDPWSRP